MNKRPEHNPVITKKVNLIKLSADVHKRDFKVSRQIGDQNIQPTQVFEPQEAFEWALKQLDLAERVVFCYEAGFSGFSLARRLQAKGVEPVVMCPQKLDERCKRVNTDKKDSRAIAGRLDRFLAGNTEALVKVRIPTEKEEDERAISRQRDQLMKARKRFEAQGRSLLLFKGLACPPHWWRGGKPVGTKPSSNRVGPRRWSNCWKFIGVWPWRRTRKWRDWVCGWKKPRRKTCLRVCRPCRMDLAN
jgi:transposase